MGKTKKTLVALLSMVILAAMCLFTLTACGEPLSAIEVTTPPTKTDYIDGEKFDPTGMVISAVYGEGEKAKKEAITGYSYPDEVLKKGTKKVTVTYTEGEITKTVDVKINVTNNATNLVIKTNATKTEYMRGEKFDPAGLTFTATLQNGQTEDIEASKATFKDETLKGNTTEVEFTYLGATCKVPVKVTPGFFAEAEEAEIVSSASEIKDDAKDKDGNNTATGGKYVGNMFAGDTISFAFSADKAGKGEIAFRLASLYLKKDSNWTPIWMGDCQFNKIVKFSVNGVNYTINDDAVLPGGGSENGEPDATLWTNWKEVVFTNIDFIAGRNVVVLEFIPHDYKDTSQSSFSGRFTANVDSLKVTSSTVEVDEFTGKTSIDELTVTEADIAKVTEGEGADATDSVVLTLKGKVDYTGYLKAEIPAKLGCSVGTVLEKTVDDNGNYTIKTDVTGITAASTAISVTAGEKELPVTIPSFAEKSVKIDATHYQYTLKAGEGDAVALEVKFTASITTDVTAVKLELNENVPTFVIEGNLAYAEYTWAEVEKSFASFVEFDFQGDLAAGGNNRLLNAADDHKCTLTAGAAGAGTFVMKVDISSLSGAKYSTHFGNGLPNFNFITDAEAESHNYDKSKVSTATIEYMHVTYKLVYEPEYDKDKGNPDKNSDPAVRKEHYYGCVGLELTRAEGLKFEYKAVSPELKLDGDKVIYVVNGTYDAAVYTDDEVKILIGKLPLNLQDNPNAGGNANWASKNYYAVKVTIDPTAKTFSAEYDVTAHPYLASTTHFGGSGSDADFKPADKTYTNKVTVGGKEYEMVITDVFWNCVGLYIRPVSDTPAA